MYRITLLLAIVVVVASACAAAGPEVRVTLIDQQVVVGRLTTESFHMKTGLGELAFDAADAGEVGPLEGPGIDAAGHMVHLWLKNGSEFIGEWDRPAVEILFEVGGEGHSIDVPIEKLARLQFRGDEVWPEDEVFRIRTKEGDDFFVDVTKTQLEFANELGTFRPFLEEIARLDPLDDAKSKWRIHLENGSSLVAELKQSELDLAFDLGPESFTLPLAAVVSMQKEAYGPPADAGFLAQSSGRSGSPAHDSGVDFRTYEDFQGFYSNARQKAAKAPAHQGD